MAGGHGEGGSEDSESGVGRTMNIFFNSCLRFYIVSQDACDSRATIYDERAKPVLSVVSNFLIKKKSSCFLQMVVVVGVVATRVGRSYLQLEK